MLHAITQSHWVDRVGWVLVHSLWQFALVALLAAAVQWALRRRSAATRYAALLAAMSIVVVLSAATWFAIGPVEKPLAVAPAPAEDDTGVLLPPQSASGETPLLRPMPALPEARTAEFAETPQVVPVHQDAAPAAPLAWWSSMKTRVEPWLPAIVLVWIAGVVVFAFRPLASWYTVRRLRSVGVSPVSAAILDVLHRTAKRLRLPRAVAVLQSTLVKTPVVIGYFRPLVLLPLCVVTGLPESQLELILAHELAHIRRHDYLVNLLQTLIETLFFYHPAVWWLSRQIRHERENCCDDVAMSLSDSRADYGRALLAIEELRAAAPTLSLAAGGGSLLARIRRIAGREPVPRATGGIVLAAIVVPLAILALVLWGSAPAAEKPKSADQPGKSSATEATGKERPAIERDSATVEGELKWAEQLAIEMRAVKIGSRETSLRADRLRFDKQKDGTVVRVRFIRTAPRQADRGWWKVRVETLLEDRRVYHSREISVSADSMGTVNGSAAREVEIPLKGNVGSSERLARYRLSIFGMETSEIEQTIEGAFALNGQIETDLTTYAAGKPDLMQCHNIRFETGSGELGATIYSDRGGFRQTPCALRVELFDAGGKSLGYSERVFGAQLGGPSAAKGISEYLYVTLGAAARFTGASRFRLSLRRVSTQALAAIDEALDIDHFSGRVDYDVQVRHGEMWGFPLSLRPITFATDSNGGVSAKVGIDWPPVQNATYRMHVELLDSAGQVVKTAVARFAVKDDPTWGVRISSNLPVPKRAFLRLDLGPRKDLVAAARVRVSLLAGENQAKEVELAEETETKHYQALFGKLKAQIVDASQAGKTEMPATFADNLNSSVNGRLLYLRVLRVDQYASKDGMDVPSKTTALIDKPLSAWKVPVPAVRNLMGEGPHISRHSQDYRDWLLIESGRLESGRYADDLAIQAATSVKRPGEWPTGSEEVKAAIALLEQPWQTKVTDEELDKAAEKLKPAADEAVDEIMRAFNRSGQQFAYRHRTVQLLQRLGTPKARATLLDIALGHSAEDLSSNKAWASAHYLRITPDPAGARKLLASDDADVLGNVLRRLKGEEVDEELLKRLVELTAYKTNEPDSQWWPRVLAANVMAADPSGRFAARKVEAILAAVEDVANMPDADKVQKLSIGTNAERCYFAYMRALAAMRGADDTLRQAAGRGTPVARDIVTIARAERGDAATRPDLRRIIEDPKAGLRRAWAAHGLGVVGTKDDLPLLKKLADSDPLERQDMRTDVGPPGTYFPVREATRAAAKEIESRQKPAAPKASDPSDTTTAAKPATDLLREFKEEKVFWKQGEIARKLIAAGDKRVVPEIVPMLASEDRHIRCNAAWVLAGLGDERGLPAVLAELKDTSDRLNVWGFIRSDGAPYVAGQIEADRYYAAQVLEKIGDRRAVPALIEALQDKDINYEAACALAHLGDQRAVPALLAALERAKEVPPTSVNGDMRFWAGYALMGLGHLEGKKTLLEIFKNGHDILRRYASDAFVEFPDKAAVPLLIRATADKDAENAPPVLLRLRREIRGNAIVALGKIGDEAALPTLRALLADHGKEEVVARLRYDPPLFKTMTVREAATQAIEEIDRRRKVDAGNPANGPSGNPSAAKSAAPPGEPPIEVRVVTAQALWEVNERTAHVLRITNRSARPVTLPSLHFLKEKGEQGEVAFYLKEHILKMEVLRDSKPISINEKPPARPEKPQSFPTVELQPKKTVSVDFSLTLTEPGEYTLTVTLDTTAVQGDNIPKSRFTSLPARFRIVPITTFRKQGANESAGDYARAWVAFYLHRIEEHKGEYLPNVEKMLSVQSGVPALIDTLDSRDKQLSKRAEAILAEIHHSLRTTHQPPLPRSKAEWLDWWRGEGEKLSVKELWSNFDSHYQ